MPDFSQINPSAKKTGLVSFDEVKAHAGRDSCWVVIGDKVWDVTSLLPNHPGGTNAILEQAGTDVTLAPGLATNSFVHRRLFDRLHSHDVLDLLPPGSLVGYVDQDTLPKIVHDDPLTEEELRILKARESLPPPSAALNLKDIERFAQQVLTETAWAYYSSAGDDEYTLHENSAAFKRYWFRPRVLNKVSRVSTATTLFGSETSLPIFIAPAALARLGHPGGEVNMVRVAGEEGIVQGISNNASCSLDEIVSARRPGQPLVFQLYMNRERAASEALVRRVEREGFNAIVLTVDAAVPGKRERDQRAKGNYSGIVPNGSSPPAGKGVAHAISGYQDPDVDWADVKWLQSITSLPLILKGIQCVEDAELAFENGVQGIVLSNHGGRELDFAPAPLTVLHELQHKRPDLVRERDVYIDGGVTRGTDVLKALCLGAKGVGLGRAFLYGNGVWGEDGVRRVIEIMRGEIETGMQLMGVTSIKDLKPELIRYVDRDLPPIASR
ncbi:hypothetical protein SISSUDRAFT_986378 [Sistotremastrum suecicum HHB10207 ss-3]|uniref:L-lactate dehydrogenase (cytochrome) n=1 Tax=Sistotremastrum suecicum HHB10207 ss-3 TaxID=1314776 RepID=A0A166DCE5_9AGAM|nr:hypothetical protein SISSUDRAFT_986378 [Sistotremastrum suecicum HHB10207 ss-3]